VLRAEGPRRASEKGQEEPHEAQVQSPAPREDQRHAQGSDWLKSSSAEKDMGVLEDKWNRS